MQGGGSSYVLLHDLGGGSSTDHINEKIVKNDMTSR